MSGRASYAAAAEPARAAFRKARKLGCTLEEHVALDAVVSFTALYSKLGDYVSVAQIAEAAGLHPKNAASALARLAAKEVIQYRPGSGRGNLSWVGLPAEKGAEEAPLYADEKAAREAPLCAAEKGSRSDPEKGASLRARVKTGPRSIPRRSKQAAGPAIEVEGKPAAAGELRIELQELGWSERQVEAGTAEPDRARAWIKQAEQESHSNPGGYAWTGFRSGDDPTHTGARSVRYTGARWVTGQGGGTHVRDPLGTDKPPADWPHEKPTRDEIRDAVAANGGDPVRRKLTPEQREERQRARMVAHDKEREERWAAEEAEKCR